MYVFVTTKCNMACLHCCHFCRPGKGSHMTMELFERACKFARKHHKEIMIGGGEPTLQPRLVDMIKMAHEYQEYKQPVFMITNGSCSTELWKELVKLDKERMLSVHVSDSVFHNKALQNPYVMRSAAQRGMRWNSMYYSNKTCDVELAGRARRNRKQIEAYLAKLGWKAEYSGPEDREIPGLMPNGRLSGMATGKMEDLGELSIRNYYKAFR